MPGGDGHFSCNWGHSLQRIACAVWNNKRLFYKVQVQGKVFNKVLKW